MARMIFVNLPVKDLDTSKAFFTALGFAIDPVFTNDAAACVVVEKDSIHVMLLTEPFFQSFINDSIADASTSREVLNCLSCASREEVDELLAKAIAAGGKPWKPVMDQGPMYGASFQDPDGHVWELAYMDMEQVLGQS
ncbi:MAG TPA: VOC family protein [Frankiaceae bacterium]|nr:VOC family protein [Frankiaceae bacterium]